MWKNYLVVGLRTLQRYKTYAAINVLGLAVGIAVCLVVAIAVRHSLSYDRFHTTADRIYRLVQPELPMLDFGTPRMPRGLAATVEDRLPGVERVTAVITKGRRLVTVDDQALYVDGILAADDQFFQTFSFPLKRGDPTSVLNRPGEAVLSETLSKQLFGDGEAVGRILTIASPSASTQYRVSGVVADPPSNSHLQFDVVLSLTASEREARYTHTIEWGRYEQYIYAVLHDGISPESAETALNSMGSSAAPEVYLEPLTRIYLHSDPNLNGDIALKSDVRYIYVLSGIALLTLLIACVTFVNLALARGLNRSLEVGVRKVLGASRVQIASQLIAESIVTILLSIPVALLIASLALPVISATIGMELSLKMLGDNEFLLALGTVLLVVGIAAGGYPSFVLSRMKPGRALYGKSAFVGRDRRGFRRGLIALQFVVAIGLIIAVSVMYRQMEYIQKQRLGVEEQVILINGRTVADSDAAAFKRELTSRSHVVSVATGLPPGLDGGGLASTAPSETEEIVWMKGIRGDADYIPTLDLQMIAGNNFRADGPQDQGFIINETAARRLGITHEEIGRRTSIGSWDDVLIRGVVADFHHRSLRDPIQPLYMYYTSVESSSRGFYLVRLSADAISRGIEQVEAVWSSFVPDRPLDFSFLDERIEQQYAAERRLIRVFGAFATLAIFLACLGLFGLGGYTVERRMKELSIRKVLGASVRNVFMLVSRDLLVPGLWAGLVAAPIAYFMMDRWLDGFAYRVDVPAWVLLYSTILSILVAWLTISSHLIRIARVNPAEILRNE